MSLKDEVATLKRREQELCHGHWQTDGDARSWDEDGYASSWVNTPFCAWCSGEPDTGIQMCQQAHEADFIANSRNLIPELIAELERLWKIEESARNLEPLGINTYGMASFAALREALTAKE